MGKLPIVIAIGYTIELVRMGFAPPSILPSPLCLLKKAGRTPSENFIHSPFGQVGGTQMFHPQLSKCIFVLHCQGQSIFLAKNLPADP